MRLLSTTLFFLLVISNLTAQNNRTFSANNFTPINPESFNVIAPGSILYLDAGNTSSYSGTGTTWNDISGKLNNMNIPATVASSFTNTNGGSFLFAQSSTNTIVNTSLNNFIFSNNAISVEVWYKRVATTDYQFWVSDNTANYRFGTNSAGNLFWNMGSRSDRSYNSYTLPTGVWKHIVVTGGLEAGVIVMRYYVDGVLVISNNEVITSLPSFTSLLIGSGELNSIYLLKGNLAVCRVYSKALSATEVLQNFTVNKSRFGL
jgi:hypothetical protein